jgi:dUTP pyrophosphatase
MCVLTGVDAENLVESMIDPKVQTQMCGIELTLKRVERFLSRGTLAYDNKDRELPETEEIGFDQSGFVELDSGAYLVTFNEIVNIPKNVTALARSRSSLLRSGATLETALWDPGYRGRSQSLLVVHNQSGIKLKKNARLLQLVFMELCHDSEKIYSGAYQGENI